MGKSKKMPNSLDGDKNRGNTSSIKKTSKGYKVKSMSEIDFISFVYDRYNNFFEEDEKTGEKKPDLEVTSQIDALKNIIQYVKQRKQDGLTLDEIDTEVYEFMEDFMSSIMYPSLADFFRLRTVEYVNGMDLTKYFEQVVEKKINVLEYSWRNKENYTVNLDSNILIEVCRTLTFIVKNPVTPKEGELKDLCDHIEKNCLTADDIPLMKKYFALANKEQNIGRANVWKKMTEDLDVLRKRFIKNIPNMFEVEEYSYGKEDLIIKMQGAEKKVISKPQPEAKETSAYAILSNPGSKIPKIPEVGIEGNDGLLSRTKSTVHVTDLPKKMAKFRPKFKSPFIGDNDDSNLLLLMYELIEMYTYRDTPEEKEEFIDSVYRVFMDSEYLQDKIRKERAKQNAYLLFGLLKYEKNPLDITESMLIRLAHIIDFFQQKGDLDRYCQTNNERLEKIDMGALQVDSQNVFEKFIKTDDRRPYYFREGNSDEDLYYGNIVKNAPISNASEEAIIGMSGFYSNRLAKETEKYSRISYICAQRNIIEKAYNDPDFEFEDLGYTEEDIALIMAVCDEMRFRMKRVYYDKIPKNKVLYEEREVEELTPLLEDIVNVYNSYFTDKGFNFDFERDLPLMIKDVKVTEKAYELKDYAVKSLIYTALTDKSKSIINWGYVAEDENRNESKILIGFDIKGLNMPVYYHVDKQELIDLLKKITGDRCEIPVYIGGDDMYSYRLRRRITTQILYPMSKDEKNKGLLRIDGNAAQTQIYKHMKWLQQPNNSPYPKKTPGEVVFNVETNESRVVKKESKETSKSIDKPEKSVQQKLVPAGHGNVGSSSKNEKVNQKSKKKPEKSKKKNKAKNAKKSGHSCR